MLNQSILINEWHLPIELRNATIAQKYDWLKKEYVKGNTHIILNNTNVFGPYSQPEKQWDISEAQKVAIYNQEVAKVLAWVMTRIVINLSCIDYKTLGVLIRIATGMLNKCNISKELNEMFHCNMCANLTAEHTKCVLSVLPF